MAKSSAAYYEVRWRPSGSDEAWSAPQSVNPADEIVVEGLPRTKTYEFEVRAVSHCGAKSDWVLSDHAIPDAPPGSISLPDLKDEVDQAQADATQALEDLGNIASDNMLTAGEKPIVIRDYNVILTEQPGIDAQATAFGVTTEKTTYDAAVTALVDYLASLATPTDWNDLSGDTTIDGPTFRGKWQDVYTSRQACLNAIYAAAKQKAQDAQDTADQVQGSAVVQNSNFTKNLNGWVFEATAGPVAAGEFVRGNDTDSPVYSLIPTHLKHTGQAGQSSAYAVNQSFVPVQAGQQVIGVVALRNISANSGARAQAFLRFYDKSGTYLGFLAGTPSIVPGSADQLNSTAKGSAPANAAFGRICILYTGHTSGVITATCARLTATITNQDDLPSGSSYVQTPASQFHSETVDNATFAAPIDAQGNVPGWKPFFSGVLSYFFSSVQYNANVLEVDGTVQFCGAESIRKYPCRPGDYASVTADLYTDTGSGVAAIAVKFYSSTDVDLGSNIAQNSTFNTWETKTAKGKAPASAAYFTIVPHHRATGGGRFYVTNIRLSVNDVRVAGSGATLGNQLNAPNSLTLNYGAVRSATALTATSAGAVSVNAFTYYMGSASVSYNAVSNAVTGLTQTKTYQVYTRDAGPTGGTKAWSATQNANILLQTYDDIVVAGQVTIPSSGTSGGGDPGPGCPVLDAWVIRKAGDGREFARAGTVRAGDHLLKVDGTWGLVTHSERKWRPCVRVTAGADRTLSCSRSAPLGLVLGGSVLAPDARRHILRGFEGDAEHGALIDLVEELPDQWVQHITCEDDFFWVGDHPAFLFSHHNLKPG